MAKTSAQVKEYLKKRRAEQGGEVDVVVATIAAAASLSGVIDIGGFKEIGIIMPAAWTTAANISFVASSTPDGTFVKVQDDQGNETKLAGVAASVAIGFDTQNNDLKAFRFIKLRSGIAATPVAQAAERKITVLLKK